MQEAAGIVRKKRKKEKSPFLNHKKRSILPKQNQTKENLNQLHNCQICRWNSLPEVVVSLVRDVINNKKCKSIKLYMLHIKYTHAHTKENKNQYKRQYMNTRAGETVRKRNNNQADNRETGRRREFNTDQRPVALNQHRD